MAIHGYQTSKIAMDKEFARDVEKGLSSEPKFLLSKYFYDDIGDEIFVKIMNMPEYYLTNSEFEILSEQAKDIIHAMGVAGEEFDLYELGAGDGTKTIQLLSALKDEEFTYHPIDISENAIAKLNDRLNKELPWLDHKGIVGEYFQVLDKMKSPRKKIVLFLGSNMGNLLDERSSFFIQNLASTLGEGDKVLVGVDRKKSDDIILPAYNDAQGFSKDFNLNLLTRMNKEFDSNFDINKFKHKPKYDELEGVAYSFLESTEDQSVDIPMLEMRVHFKKGELIHTEISRKYDDEVIKKIIQGSGLKIHSVFSDKKQYFSDYLLEKH